MCILQHKKGMEIKDRIIELLGLQPLPEEGGYFCETYRSLTEVPILSKSEKKTLNRNLGTCIYYLITPEEFSTLHRLPSDEIFHFYQGDPVEMIQISELGEISTVILGSNILEGQQVQALVPGGVWQGTRLAQGGQYALLGTTVFPGFDYSDFELGLRVDLANQFPNLSSAIAKFTRP